MTISTELRKAGPFTGNGVTTAFPFSFKVFAATDVAVTVANTQGNESALALGADYAVALNADRDAAPGGTVTLAAPLASGHRLVVSSAVPNLQPTDITNNGGFYPRVIEDALDRHVAQVQQIDEKVARALKVAITSPLGDQALPSPVAGMLIGWNESSDGLKNYAPIGGTLLGQQLAAANGSSLVGFQQAGVGAVVRTAQAKLREVVSVKDFGVIGDGSDESVKVQAALDSGASVVYFPKPATYYNFGDININTRGQSLVGESWRTCGVVPRGTNCFNVRENGVEITGFWFRPATVITSQQDTANTTNLVRIRHLAGEDLGLDGLRFHDNYCQNIAGAAILLKSPLRESHIYKNQFRGMGSVASSLGVIHTDMNTTFTDNTNYVYIYENVFYRAEKPFIYCKAVDGSNPAKRYHDNWYIQNNLFHGQLLDESVAVADPTGPVVGGNTHMLLMRSVDNFVIENNTFTSFNGDYSAVYVDALTTDDKNGPVYVRNNRVFVDNKGTYTGTAIVLSDCFTSEAVGNTFSAGFQTNQISVINTGTFTYTPVVEVRNNRSQNQFAVAVSLPSTYTTSDGIIRTLTATTVNTERTAISDRINYKRAGRTALSGGATTAAITWAGLGMPNMPNGNYDVYMRVVDQNLVSWASATTNSGFTINLASNPGTRTVSWFVIDSTGF